MCRLESAEWNGSHGRPCDGGTLVPQGNMCWKPGTETDFTWRHVTFVQPGVCFLNVGETIYCLFSKFLLLLFNFILDILGIE